MSESWFSSFPVLSRNAVLESQGILVVEPQTSMLRLMREFLSDIGARGLTGTMTAEDALLKLQERPFALVIADVRLSDLDGIELTRQMRYGFRDGRRRTPVLLTMEMATAGRIREARDAGVNEILLKPFNLQGLERKVSAALTDRRAFIETLHYTGPERRRDAARAHRGPFRRKSDISTNVLV
ncbi:MAG: response regulator [Micropepsaceae bacterium]